jgi:signal transduction histidine kinase
VTRSIRNRLALAFFAITAAAVAIVYVYVTPSLSSSLRAEKLSALQSAAGADSGAITATVGTNVQHAGVVAAVAHAAALSGARVSLLGVTRSSADGRVSVQTYPITDSAAESPARSDLRLAVAAKAAATGRTLSATESGSGGHVGEVAVPLFFQGRVARVAVYSEPLNDVARSVALIRRKILLSGAVGLILALVAGTLVARALSQRIKRLERSAWQVAGGDFSAHFEVDSQDELGQLARALGGMQHQLAELDSARERFIAVASHELRTPIFSLAGFLELIEDEELDEETRREFLAQLRAQVDRLVRLTTALLDLSRLEAGGLELHPETVDLAEVARSVTGEFVPALGGHNSHLKLRLTHEPLPVICDPDRVAQVLRILIDNAITHTPPGTDMVVTATRIGPYPADGDGPGGARITVRDHGPGVPREAMPRVFEPFFTSDGVQGSGLGLAIAHELADRMRGRLYAESAPGRTVFTFELAG